MKKKKQNVLNDDLISRKMVIEVVHDYFLSELNKEEAEEVNANVVYKNMAAVNKLLHHNKVISERIKALPPVEQNNITEDSRNEID